MADHVFDRVPPGFRRQAGVPGVIIPRDPKRGHTNKKLRQENAALKDQLASLEERMAALEGVAPATEEKPKRGKKAKEE
jgi:hypothetical protein